MTGLILAPKLIGSVAGAYLGDAGVFDGSSDNMLYLGDPIAAADKLTLSCWLNFQGGNGSLTRLSANTGGRFDFRKNADNTITVAGLTSVDGGCFTLTSTSTFTDASGWIHVAAAVDTPNDNVHLWIDGSQDEGTASVTTDAVCDLDSGEFAIGSNISETQRFNGYMAEFWLANTYLDISVAANLQLYRSSGGEAVDLGADGSNPGAQPEIFLHLDDGETASNFKDNPGSAGPFTITGDLASTDGPNG